MSREPGGFEGAFARLEEIIARIDGGELDLDEALALFEEGVGLLRLTGYQLDEAELRVQQLLVEGDGWTLRPFGGDA